MYIEKRHRKSGVRYKVIIRRNGRVIRTKTFPRKSEAIAWGKRMDVELDSADPGSNIRFRSLADQYLDWWSQHHKDTENQTDRLAWWNERLGSKRLSDITPPIIRRFLNDLKGKAPATVNRHLAVLSSCLKWGIQQGYLSENPCSKVPSVPANNKRVRYLSDDERERLLVACDSSDWASLGLLVRMALGTGARLSEVLNLSWSDIDFNPSLWDNLENS